MSKTYRNQPDDWENYEQKKTVRPARAAQPPRPIGDNRTYRVTSKRRNAIDYDKYVAAITRWVIAQAEADADNDPDAETKPRRKSRIEEHDEPEIAEPGGSDE